MQPDYSKMAQAPKAQGTSLQEPSQEDIALAQKEIQMSEQDYKDVEMPSGNDAESIKQRIMLFFERSGFMEDLSQEGLLELQQKIDDFVQAVIAKDKEKVLNHPITKIMNRAAAEIKGQAEPQAAPQPAAPTNFAGMVKPPMGGGMSGR